MRLGPGWGWWCCAPWPTGAHGFSGAVVQGAVHGGLARPPSGVACRAAIGGGVLWGVRWLGGGWGGVGGGAGPWPWSDWLAVCGLVQNKTPTWCSPWAGPPECIPVCHLPPSPFLVSCCHLWYSLTACPGAAAVRSQGCVAAAGGLGRWGQDVPLHKLRSISLHTSWISILSPWRSCPAVGLSSGAGVCLCPSLCTQPRKTENTTTHMPCTPPAWPWALAGQPACTPPCLLLELLLDLSCPGGVLTWLLYSVNASWDGGGACSCSHRAP